ncbi:MAG: TonB-dependent receptor [Myxococcales bacterium]|nr:TonB-dependent receptor [Myxococcales bacterium]
MTPIDLATALAQAEVIELWDERPDKPFDRDTTPRQDAAELRRRGVTDVAAAIALLPDVVVREAGRGGRQIDIRGARRSAVKVLIDGVAIDDPYFGNFDLSSLPTTDLAQVRVSTAPASPIDGAGGPGGVVELHTTDAIGAAELLARATASSERASVVAVTGRHAIAAHTAVRVSATGELGDRAFDVPGPVDVDEGRRSASAAVRVEHRRGRHRLVVDAFGLARGYVVPPIEDDTAEITQIDRELLGRVSAQYDGRFGRWQVLAHAYGHGTTRLTQFFLDPTLTTPEAREDVRANRAGVGALATRGLGPRTRAVAAVHLDTEAARVDDGLTLSRGRSTVAELAAGGQFENAWLRLDGAVGVAVPLGLGAPARPEAKLVAALRPTPLVAMIATVARKGRLPTLRERFRSDTGNAALDGETNDFGEVRIELGDARLLVSSAAWARLSDGLIKTDFATRRFSNSGALDLQGLDVAATVGRDRRIEAGAAYSFVEASAPGLGEPLDFLARHRGQLHVAVRPTATVWAEVRLRLMGRRLDRQQWLPEYQAVDASVSGSRGAWVGSAQLSDLLDERYEVRAGVPSSGRAVSASVTRRW